MGIYYFGSPAYEMNMNKTPFQYVSIILSDQTLIGLFKLQSFQVSSF